MRVIEALVPVAHSFRFIHLIVGFFFLLGSQGGILIGIDIAQATTHTFTLIEYVMRRVHSHTRWGDSREILYRWSILWSQPRTGW